MYQPLVILHVTSAMVWVGAVFMGTFVDWPASRAAANGRFPFEFIVWQGVKVAPAVYVGIVSQVVSGIGLVLLRPPRTLEESVLLGVKALCLAFMAGSTIYGTLVTWPKLQFASDEEAFRLYRVYMVRATITFVCGIAGGVIGTFLR